MCEDQEAKPVTQRVASQTADLRIKPGVSDGDSTGQGLRQQSIYTEGSGRHACRLAFEKAGKKNPSSVVKNF